MPATHCCTKSSHRAITYYYFRTPVNSQFCNLCICTSLRPAQTCNYLSRQKQNMRDGMRSFASHSIAGVKSSFNQRLCTSWDKRWYHRQQMNKNSFLTSRIACHDCRQRVLITRGKLWVVLSLVHLIRSFHDALTFVFFFTLDHSLQSTLLTSTSSSITLLLHFY